MYLLLHNGPNNEQQHLIEAERQLRRAAGEQGTMAAGSRRRSRHGRPQPRCCYMHAVDHLAGRSASGCRNIPEVKSTTYRPAGDLSRQADYSFKNGKASFEREAAKDRATAV
jgi:hypothetical protein